MKIVLRTYNLHGLSTSAEAAKVRALDTVVPRGYLIRGYPLALGDVTNLVSFTCCDIVPIDEVHWGDIKSYYR